MRPLTSSLRYLTLGGTLENAAATSKLPTKPVSAYGMYVSSNYKLVKKAQPNAKSQEIFKQLASKWKVLPETQKSSFVTAYEKELNMYKAKMARVPEKDLAEANRESALKRATKAKNKIKAEVDELLTKLKKPSRPGSGYALFVAEKYPHVQKQGIVGPDAMKVISAGWAKMTDRQKAKYTNDANDAMEKYRKDVQNWTKRMERSGKMQVIKEAEDRLSMAKTKLKDI